MNILLLGNGPSVLNYHLGNVINSFEIVVRFNNFEIEGYEKNVGTKTDILCRRACDDVTWWPKSMFQKVYCFVPQCKWTPWMAPVVKQVSRFYTNKLIVVGEDITSKTAFKMGLVNPQVHWPSIGILAVDYFLKWYDRVTIHGFDHLTQDNGQVKHYYPTPPKDAIYHDGDAEKKYVGDLINKNKVARLIGD